MNLGIDFVPFFKKATYSKFLQFNQQNTLIYFSIIYQFSNLTVRNLSHILEILLYEFLVPIDEIQRHFLILQRIKNNQKTFALTLISMALMVQKRKML